MADDLDELRQEVEELKEMAQDTNRQVHNMRRSARWALFFRIIWWLIVFGVTGAAYYYYLQPYVQKVENLYLGAQHGATQAQNWGQEIGQFFAKYFTAPTSTQP